MAGQIDVVFDNMPSSGGLIAGGNLRRWRSPAPSGLASLPDVPPCRGGRLKPMNQMSW